MKTSHLWGCLLLIIVVTACEKKDEEGLSIALGQFIYEGVKHDLHYGSIHQNEWSLDCYEASFYSYDKATQLDLQFYNHGGIISGIYESFGFTVHTSGQQVNARLTLRHVPEGEVPSGLLYMVEFDKTTNEIYNLRICSADYPDTNIINWKGKLLLPKKF